MADVDTSVALSKTAQRVLDRIASHAPCSHIGFLSNDLDLQRVTVERIVKRLVAADRIELTPGYGMCSDYYTVTCAEARDRTTDAEFRRHFPRTP